MVPFCDVVRRAVAAMVPDEDHGLPVHRRHHRYQCEVRDVGSSDPDDPPPSPPRTAGRRVRPPRGSRVGFNFAILFPNSDGFDRPRLTERRAGLVRIWLAGVEDECRFEDAHDAMEEVITAVRAQHQVSGCGGFAIGWEVPVGMVPWPPGLDTATRVKQEREPLASTDTAAGIAEALRAQAEPCAGKLGSPRASPPKKRQRQRGILRRPAGSTAASSTGPAGSTAAASSAASSVGPAGSTAAASSACPAGATAPASTAAGITGSPTTSPAPAPRPNILRSGGDGCPCTGNCGAKRCKRRQNNRREVLHLRCGRASDVSTTLYCVDCRCMAHGCGLMRYKLGDAAAAARWCRPHGERFARHDSGLEYVCDHGVRSFLPSWPPVIRFIAKFGCVLRHLLPLDAVRMREFAYDLLTTDQPTILPSDALVAIYFAHGIKWPAAVGYLRDALTGRARPWTASHFEEAIRHCIVKCDGERRRKLFRGMNSSPRMNAITGLAVNGAAWGVLAAHAGSSRRKTTVVSLGPAGTRYEVLQTPELRETIVHVMGAAAAFVDDIAGSSAMPRDVAGVTNFLEQLALFYRRARGKNLNGGLATRGYCTKHFTRVFLMVLQRVDPGVCDMAPYKVLAGFLPDEHDHIPASLGELTGAELGKLFDVGVAELPMWACLADKDEELVSKLLVDGDVSRVVAWQRDREPIDCDGDEWPMTVPDTLEEWLKL